MTETTSQPKASPADCGRVPFHADVTEFLGARGFAPATVEALLGYDMALFRWRRMAEKGQFLSRVLSKVEPQLEPAILHGLLAVANIAAGLDTARPQAPTVGLVAEKLGLDPSRASRIVADLVTRGLVERQADQDDARRTVLAMTPRAKAFLADFTAAKWAIMAEVFEGWTEAEIDSYSRLFTRYLDRLTEIVAGPDEAG